MVYKLNMLHELKPDESEPRAELGNLFGLGSSFCNLKVTTVQIFTVLSLIYRDRTWGVFGWFLCSVKVFVIVNPTDRRTHWQNITISIPKYSNYITY